MTDHRKTVQAIYDAFQRGDMASILAKMSPDVVWDGWLDNRAQKAGVPWLQCRKGREGVADFFRSLEVLEFRKFQVRNLLEGGNQVAADVAVEFEVRASGVVFHDEEIHLWIFDASGEVVRFRHYTDTAKQIDAAQTMSK
jgi:ketosteroid isomerase-like protein